MIIVDHNPCRADVTHVYFYRKIDFSKTCFLTSISTELDVTNRFVQLHSFFGVSREGSWEGIKKRGSQVGFEEVRKIVGNEEFLHKSHIKIKGK